MSNDVYERKPLLNFSETQERATLVDSDFEEESMSPKKRGKKSKTGGKRKKGSKRKGIRFNKGRLAIKVKGYDGLQHLTASELVHFIPLSKLRSAAKKVLKRSGKSKKKGKKRKGKKRKGKKR